MLLSEVTVKGLGSSKSVESQLPQISGQGRADAQGSVDVAAGGEKPLPSANYASVKSLGFFMGNKEIHSTLQQNRVIRTDEERERRKAEENAA